MFSLSLRGLAAGLLFSGLGLSVPTAEPVEIESRGPGVCHGPNNRACWNAGFNINTDYEQKIPAGKTRKFHWEITERDGWTGPDGVAKDSVMLIDGKAPGPLLEADWGDHIEVTITNNLWYNGTSVHWHGIRMSDNNINDGVNGVTECPIPPGSSKTYKFRAEQYGTGWYHSHFSSQYGNGVFGTMIIHGPASANYDIDLGAYPIYDYYHGTADKIVYDVMNGEIPPTSDMILFNGKGVNADGVGEYSRLNFTPGKRHRLRLINPSAEHHYQVSIVNHDLTVIATDFVPVEPVKTDNVFLAVGQRMDVIVTANQSPGNYWLNATMYSENFCGESYQKYPAAIVHYNKKGVDAKALPTIAGDKPENSYCMDRQDWVPKVKRTVDINKFQPKLDNTLEMDLIKSDDGYTLWTINDSSMRVQWDRPVLEYVLEGNTSYPTEDNLVHVDEKDAWTFWVIQNNSTLDHPMHLHGHDLYVLGVSERDSGFAFSTDDIQSLKSKNPTRRDTAMVPKNGWLVIAYRADNPGNWLFHCHIAWHVSGGLAADFMERVGEQAALISPQEERTFAKECAAWSTYWENAGLEQHDSGAREKPKGPISGV